MSKEKLYDLAMEYKKTKLWKQLLDTELFALELSNGEIGYCSVMGELGEHIALGLYVGRNGLDSFRELFEAEGADTVMAQREIILSQNCIQCSFENKDELSPQEIEEARRYAKTHGITYRGQNAFPQFKRYRPAHYPWFVKDETDEKLLYEALSAALEIAEKLKTINKGSLGFSDGAPYGRRIPFLVKSKSGSQLSTIELADKQERIYPSPRLRDEILLARLKQKKKTNRAWACEVVMFPSPMSDEAGDDEFVALPENAPTFPFALIIADCKSEMVIPCDLVSDYNLEAEKLLGSLARAMREHGVPSEIQVRDRRTEALLTNFSGQVGAKIVRCDDIPLLDEIEEEMLAHFSEEQDGEEDEAERVFEMLMEMDDSMLRSIPRELRTQLLELDRQGALPAPVSERVRRLFK